MNHTTNAPPRTPAPPVEDGGGSEDDREARRRLASVLMPGASEGVVRDRERSLVVAVWHVHIAVERWAERRAIGAAVLSDLTDELQAIR
jgi:hypothetical protein